MKCKHCGFDNHPDSTLCRQCGMSLTAKPDRLTPADLDQLSSYLPAPLSEALRSDLLAPPPRLLEQCQTHLLQLLTITTSHLPAYLVEHVLRDPTPGRVGGRFLNGTLLFADISGFTAMSERLSHSAREGAEELTTIVNHYFSVMLSLLLR